MGNYVRYDQNGDLTDGSIINTGSNSDYALNNIYDMAGNVEEWTMECYSTEERIGRGGCFYSLGSANPVSVRFYDYSGYYSLSHVGFRLALYIK